MILLYYFAFQYLLEDVAMLCCASHCQKYAMFVGAVLRNAGAKSAVFMTGSETAVQSVTASTATSAAAMKPYVVAAVVNPSEVLA